MANGERSHIPGDRPISLILLVGIPGSGKSTWARQYLQEHHDYQLVSTDQIRAELYGNEAVQGDWQQVWQRVVMLWQQGIEQIRQGQSAGVVYDATNARRRNRRQAIATARELGFDAILLIWFDVPLGVALKRNRMRSRQVPPDIVARMHRQLRGAPPSLSEDVDQILHFAAAENF
jgi:predicted kinase